MKIKKIIILLTIITTFSCTRNTNVDEILINGENDYWVYYNPNQSGYIYFKFYKDGTFNKYSRDLKGNFILFNNEGDIINNNREWIISKDSILNWSGHKYDVVNYNEKVILLLFEDSKSKLHKNIFLIKEGNSNYRKSTYYYEQKRKNNPTKYKKPY